MRLFVIFVGLSLFIHIFAIFFLPGFSVMAARPIEVIPITVEVRDKVPEKVVPMANPKVKKTDKTDIAKREAPKSADEKKNTVTPPPPDFSAPKTDENLNFTAPQIDAGMLTAVESDISANMNRLLDNTTNNKVKEDDNYVGRFINEQLAGVNRDAVTPNNTALEVGREISAAMGNVDSNFINFDVYPANNRAITYAPPKPDFSLPNDTSIRVKFQVDGRGNVYDIVLITRNIPQVESIALDYIRKLKFAANGNNDNAEITLTFKVRVK